MEIEIVRRAAMVAVIPGLIALILVTPSLLGRPALLSAIPVLIIGLTDSEVVLNVHGAVDHYMYRSVDAELRGLDNVSFRLSDRHPDAYGLNLRFDRNASAAFDVYVLIADRQGTTFALNGTVFTGTDDTGEFVSMTDRETFRTDVAYVPEDFRALVPRGQGA